MRLARHNRAGALASACHVAEAFCTPRLTIGLSFSAGSLMSFWPKRVEAPRGSSMHGQPAETEITCPVMKPHVGGKEADDPGVVGGLCKPSH